MCPLPSQKKILVVTQHFWPENFRINDIVEGFLQDGIAVDVLCGLPNYPKGEWFPGYSAAGPFEEEWHGARLYRCKEVPRRGNTSVNIFLNYVSWPWYAAHALHRLPGGYDAVFCFNTSPVLMCWPAIRYAKKHHIPFTNYVLDLWPENLYSVLPVKNRFMRWVAQSVSDSLYRRCDRLIAMSGPLQERLCARTGKSTADVAVIPLPDFKQKMVQIGYLARTANLLGITTPKIACIAPSEQLLPNVISSTEGALLAKMGDRGQLGDVVVDGPLSLDVALYKDVAEHKKVKGSSVAGDPDCLLFPNLESANVFFKSVTHLCGGELAAMVMGTKVPCVLTSRGDTSKTKLYSIALACLAVKQ
mgnify:CR=1 FL=1